MAIPLSCPSCSAQFNAPDALAGRKARCKRCGTILEIPALADEDGDGLIRLADDEPLGREVAPYVTAQPVGAPPAMPMRMATGDNALAEANYRPGDVIAPPRRRFWQDATLSFLTPARANGPLILLLLVTLVMVKAFLSFISSMIGFLGIAAMSVWLGQIIIVGWIWAYYLNVTASAAMGEDRLPPMSVEDGMVEGVFRPLVRFVGSLLWVLGPAALLAICMTATAGWPLSRGALIGVGGLALLGLFMWPMTLLTVSMYGLSVSALRYDLQLVTIARALPQYLLTCGLLLLAVGVGWVSQVGVNLWMGLGGAKPLGLVFSVSVFVAAVECWAALVAMRIIGLFYHHYKRHFAWIAE